MSTSPYRFLQHRNIRLQDSNRRFSYELAFSNERLQSTEDRLEEMQARNEDNSERAEALHRMLLESMKAEQRAKEQFRRQKEILATTQKELNDAHDGYQKLLLRIRNLEPSPDILSDDEAKDILCRLYHDLERWLQRHFPRLPPKLPTQKRDSHNPPADPTLLFFDIWSFVSRTIYGAFLRKFMVGTGPSRLDGNLASIDAKVHQLCPPHVAKHWRTATGTAISSLGASDIERAYASVISEVESEYGHNSPTLTNRRQEELRSLLEKVVDFKKRLECQTYTYRFFWINPKSLFNPDEMTSFTGTCERSAVIQYTLRPGLFKLQAGHKPIILEKAIIKPVALPRPTVAEDTDSDDEDTDEDKTFNREIKKEQTMKEVRVEKKPEVKKEPRIPGAYEADAQRESTRKRFFGCKKEDDCKIEDSSSSKMRIKVRNLSLQ
ncbi:hypothetical protein N7540_004588 [Penicillium herquei]|nr:hypothetical protein N7540_004588 [Penicillium herquei]